MDSSRQIFLDRRKVFQRLSQVWLLKIDGNDTDDLTTIAAPFPQMMININRFLPSSLFASNGGLAMGEVKIR
jgi:hypothetical protein